MCRHLAYLGPPLPLRALLFDPPHSLVRQSWAPRDMRGGGTVNADGFGIGWYADGADPEPVRYRADRPIWADPTLPDLAATIRSHAVLAAVRSATVGMPVVPTAAAPFADGRWLFSHNGVVPGWPDTLVPLAAGLPVRDLLTLDAPTDSALLWALVRHRLRAAAPDPPGAVPDPPEAAPDQPGSGRATARAGGEPSATTGSPAGAMVESVADTVRAVTAAAPGARLNLLLTDGRTAVATAAGHALSVRVGPDAVLISSEPLDDDPRWQPVPDGHLVVATAGQLSIQPMGASG